MSDEKKPPFRLDDLTSHPGYNRPSDTKQYPIMVLDDPEGPEPPRPTPEMLRAWGAAAAQERARAAEADLVERCARAAYETYDDEFVVEVGGGPWATLPEAERDRYRRVAIAMLAAAARAK